MAVGSSPVTIDYIPNGIGDSNIAGSTGDLLSVVGSGTYTGTPGPSISPSPTPTPTPTPSGTPPVITLEDRVPPTISMTAPVDGSEVTGQLNLSALAYDDVAMAG